jgi:Flp pilus assembly protein TadD
MSTAPVVVLLYDRAFLSRSFREAFRRRGALYLGLAATSAIMLLYKAPAGAGFGIKTVTPWRYALTQPGVILYYLRLSFWPQPLCLDYSWPFATTFREAAPEAFALAALLAATAWAVVRRPALGFLAAWFFLILAPTSSVMPLNDACFEHRMYLSLAAVAAGTVIAGYALIGRLARQSALPGNSVTLVAVVLALAVAVALGCATFRRNTDYRTAVSIWEDAARKRPANPRAWSNLGEAYVNASRYDEAIRACNRALEREPATNIFESATIYCNRGLACAGLGRLIEAIQDYDRAIALNPDYDRAYNNRGLACAKMGRLTEAIQDYDKAIALNPDYAQAYESRGIAYARSARPADAMRDFDQAITLNPDYAEAYYNRGNARLDANRHSEAVADYDQAIALKPDYAVAYYNRAVAHFEMKDYDKASTDVKMFMRLGGQPDPGFLDALRQATGPAK